MSKTTEKIKRFSPDKLSELLAGHPLDLTNLIMPDFNNTDAGNSGRLVYYYGKRIRYCHPWKKWLLWDRQLWKIDETAEIMRLAREVIKKIYEEASLCIDEKERKALAAYAMRSEASGKLKALVDLATSEKGVPVLPAELDQDPWLINCQNGTLNLKTGELQPHDRMNFITKIAPVEYSQEAKAPIWANFLDRIMDSNTKLINFLQRLIGYVLTGLTSEQKFPFFYGVGGNGKSVFIRVIQTLMGDYSKTISSDALMVRQGAGGEAANPYLARLVGCRFVVASETDEGRRLSESLIKSLSGQDKFATRALYGDVFEFQPTFKLLIYGNHKPVIRGNDPGIWRRVLLVPFTVRIPENEQDKELYEKLIEELPGIFAWAVQGCYEWQRGGLRPPAEVLNATEDYRQEMDSIESFINENCIVVPFAKISASELYEAYSKYCQENGELVHSQKKFGGTLTEKGFEKERGHGGRYFWKGIDLTEVNPKVALYGN